LGFRAGRNLTTGDNNIDIGNFNGISGSSTDVAGEGNTIRIGEPSTHTATYIAGISGQSAIGGAAVFVTSDGKLGTITAVSSQRFKDEIKPMDKASEAILALRPVTFRYKQDIDPKGIPQFGLVAEEVKKINPDLVTRDAKGEVYTVRYDAVNAMLLNEFLKEHQTVKDLKSTVAKQEKQIEALTTGLQKVSDQLELSKSAPRTVLNNQ
jgi:Chaperone of endosialidase